MLGFLCHGEVETIVNIKTDLLKDANPSFPLMILKTQLDFVKYLLHSTYDLGTESNLSVNSTKKYSSQV